MTYPIPGVSVGTPYGKRGSHWSCNKDSNGNGIHTGVDFPASSGTKIFAPIAGQIRHRSYGSAFGSHQFAISPDPGQPFAQGEVFFAHTRTRPKDGIYVDVGEFIAEVGAEGNVTGPHLHMEYMPSTKGTWKCGIHDDPQVVLNYSDAPYVTATVYRSKCGYGEPTNGDDSSDTVKELQHQLNHISLEGGKTIAITGRYDDDTDAEVRKWQEQILGNQPDAAQKSFLGPEQFKAMFMSSSYVRVDDGSAAIADSTPDPEPEPEPEPEPDMNYFHDYSGKPDGTLTVTDGQGYVALDAKTKAAPFSGLEFHMLYANCECVWDSSGDDGVIRVKYVRDAHGGEPADDTGYQDYTIPKGEALGDPDGFLITATHWEAGEKDRGGRWYIRCDGALKQIKIGTRYTKIGVVG